LNSKRSLMAPYNVDNGHDVVHSCGVLSTRIIDYSCRTSQTLL